MYINLIRPEEIRSSSVVRKLFLMQLGMGIVVVVLILLTISFVFGSISAAQRRKIAEADKKLLTPQYNVVGTMKRELKEFESLASIVEGLHQNRINWYQVLRTIQLNISPAIQLTRFNVGETSVQLDGVSAWIYTIYLQGKVVGEHSEMDVKKIITIFKESPCFTNILESAEVKRYVASDLPNEKEYRIFDIECIFKPIKIGK
jgi:Na+-transporting methylmalonyl-CoA/oxaloacetate decarboxylase gamma subunit